MKSHSVLVSLLALALPASTWAHLIFQQRIPNGANVIGPDGSPWLAVGHEAPDKGVVLNPFGVDFKAASFTWTLDLCQKDSDSDGRTNGQELGDPTCVWSTGDTPSSQVNITHPGLYNMEFTGQAPAAKAPLRLPLWLQFHIACMMLSWGFLLPMGALMAISFRNAFANPARWFQLHVSIQVSGVVLNIIGFCIPFLNMALHLTSAHGILGTVVFALGMTQGLQGYCRPPKPADDEKPTVARQVWEVCHKGFGRIVIVLAWTNIFLGIQLIRKDYSEVSGNDRIMTVCKALLGIQIGLCVLLTAVSLFYKSKPKEWMKEEDDEVASETAHEEEAC